MSPLPEHSDDLRVLGKLGSVTKLLTGWTAPNWVGSLGLCHQGASPNQLGENEARKLLVGCTRVLDLIAPSSSRGHWNRIWNQIVPHGTLLSFSLKETWKSITRAQWEYTFLNFIFHFWDRNWKTCKYHQNQVGNLQLSFYHRLGCKCTLLGEAVKV